MLFLVVLFVVVVFVLKHYLRKLWNTRTDSPGKQKEYFSFHSGIFSIFALCNDVVGDNLCHFGK
jgi:hypothetical protein